MPPIISVENLSKAYHLGQIGTGTFTNDLKLWWAKMRGKPNPLLRIGETDHGNRDGEDLWALRDVSFTVEQGEVLGIIGRNGAGKSTLLKILSRVTAPTSGRIRVKGRVASLLEVGTGFHPELTGRENIYLNGAILGMSKAEVTRKFDEIVDFAEIEKFIDTPVKRYSSGMYVRLAFAVAAHLEPEILVVDEVLAVGDVEFQKKCLGKMGDVAKGGRTVLFVSHNMSAIQELCGRALLVENGKLTQDSKQVKLVVEEYLGCINVHAENQLDLLAIPRNNGNSKNILFKSCTILDSKSEPNSNLMFGEPFSIMVEVISKRAYDNLSLVIGIDTITRTRISTVVSDDVDQNYKVVPGKLLKVIVAFKYLSLYPGDYLVTLAIRQGRLSLDTLMYVVRFGVSELAFHNKSTFNNTWGLVHPGTNWKATQEDFINES